MKVTKAKNQDSKEIAKIFTILNTKNYQPSNIKRIERSIKQGDCFIIKKNDKIIAAIILRKNEGSYEIEWIVSTQKEGGKTLIKFAINKCKKEKVKKLWCWSLAKYQAKGFYKKMAFEEIFLLKKQWHGKDCYFCGKIIR